MALLYTIGHSTRSSEEFVELLRQNDIRILVDARSWPNSRRYPHFNRDNMMAVRKRLTRRTGYEWPIFGLDLSPND